MDKQFFLNNRRGVFDNLEEQSLLILFAGKAPAKRGDQFYPFTPDRNFYYVIGSDDEQLIYTAYKEDKNTISETLYIERSDEIEAKWVGSSAGAEELEEKTGVQTFAYIDEFHKKTAAFLFGKQIKKVYLDMENRYFDNPSEAIRFAAVLRENYPQIAIADIHPLLAQKRMIKSAKEVEAIKKALSITKKAFLTVLENLRPGMYEYEIESYIDFIVKNEGATGTAFDTIVAAGKNATVLHYIRNRNKVKDGEMVLMDFGAQWEYYNGDITRTFPVNGKYSARQKQIYNTVLAGQKQVLDAVKPGVPFARLNALLLEYYGEALKEIGLVDAKLTGKPLAQAVNRYYYHSVGHCLGLETHDAGRGHEGLLKPGMVFTVEPGLYVAEEGIGVRIEDNVLVTETGCEILSADFIKQTEEIECYIGEHQK